MRRAALLCLLACCALVLGAARENSHLEAARDLQARGELRAAGDAFAGIARTVHSEEAFHEAVHCYLLAQPPHKENAARLLIEGATSNPGATANFAAFACSKLAGLLRPADKYLKAVCMQAAALARKEYMTRKGPDEAHAWLRAQHALGISLARGGDLNGGMAVYKEALQHARRLAKIHGEEAIAPNGPEQFVQRSDIDDLNGTRSGCFIAVAAKCQHTHSFLASPQTEPARGASTLSSACSSALPPVGSTRHRQRSW